MHPGQILQHFPITGTTVMGGTRVIHEIKVCLRGKSVPPEVAFWRTLTDTCDSGAPEAFLSASRFCNLDLNLTPGNPGIHSTLAPRLYTIRLVVSKTYVLVARFRPGVLGLLGLLGVPLRRNEGGAA